MWFLLVVAVFVTSLISGVFGMAGGLILMAVFASVLNVGEAMALHGLVQATSNGGRAWLLRSYVRWRVIVPYFGGLLVSLAVFGAVTFVPSQGLLFIVLGLVPVLGVCPPRIVSLNIENRLHAFLCGIIVSSAQLLAGASGPLLDMFFVNSQLNRHEIVGTKAITQTMGHVAKLLFYGRFVSTEMLDTDKWGWVVAMPMAAIGGARVGKAILDRLKEDRFQHLSRWVIGVLGFCLAIRGVALLW